MVQPKVELTSKNMLAINFYFQSNSFGLTEKGRNEKEDMKAFRFLIGFLGRTRRESEESLDTFFLIANILITSTIFSIFFMLSVRIHTDKS